MTTSREFNQPFLMPVEDVFGIKGRGTVVTGRIERGVVVAGDEIEIVGIGERRRVVVASIEMHQRSHDRAQAGELVGLILRDVESANVRRGHVLAAPGSVTDADVRRYS